jgi:hypothetical protein
VSVSPCGRRSVSIHRLAVKPADIYQKGSGLLARQRSRLESRGQLQSQNWEAELVITHHGTAHLSIPVLLLLRVLYLHPTELRTSITHSPHPYPYVPIYTTQTHSRTPVTACPAKREHRPATVRPPRPHQHPVHQSTRPSQPFRKLRYRRTASPAVPPRACDDQRPATLPFPRRPRPCTRIAKYSAAYWDMYLRTPTTQTTLLG